MRAEAASRGAPPLVFSRGDARTPRALNAHEGPFYTSPMRHGLVEYAVVTGALVALAVAAVALYGAELRTALGVRPAPAAARPSPPAGPPAP